MSFQWTFLATFLYVELLLVMILLLPFISPRLWDKFFKSRLARAFTAGAKYYFNFIICVFALLFADSIRELRKYAGVEMTDLKTPQAEVQAHMKQFRSQRNFYIAGFALFLWFVIKRLVNLLSDVARQMDASNSAYKQAESARLQLERLQAGDTTAVDPRDIKVPSGDASRLIDIKQHEAEVEKLRREVLKSREDIETLREQYDNSVKDYDKLNDEHRKLQNKLSVASETESPKDQ